MKLEGKTIAVLLDRGFEDLEFWVPVMRLREEGARVVIVAPEKGVTYTGKHGLKAEGDVAARNVGADTFDAVVVPGGWAPDRLRRYDAVLRLVRDTYEAGKIVAMICHAGHVGISAGIVEGHRATGTVAIRDDLINAGAEWVDEPALRDGNIVWGGVVEDIPAYCRELMAALTEREPASV